MDAAAVRQGAVLALLPAEAAVQLRAEAAGWSYRGVRRRRGGGAARAEAAVAELPRRAEAAVELPRRAEAAVAELPRRAEAAVPLRAEAVAVGVSACWSYRGVRRRRW